MSDAVGVPQEAVTGLSEGARLVDTIVAPSKTFNDLRRSSAWWGPFLIMVAVTLLFTVATQQKVGWEQVFENNLHQNTKQEERFAQMSPDQLASAKAFSVKVTQVVSYCYFAFVLFFTAFSTLLVWVTVNYGLGGKATFGQIFAVNMYSNLVLNIKFLLAAVTLFAGLAPDSFMQQNPIGSNIGFFIIADAPKKLYALTSHIDLFEIWALVLSTMGVAIVAKVSRGKAAAAVVGWWVAFILLGVAFA